MMKRSNKILVRLHLKIKMEIPGPQNDDHFFYLLQRKGDQGTINSIVVPGLVEKSLVGPY